jgi:hypothetical protein
MGFPTVPQRLRQKPCQYPCRDEKRGQECRLFIFSDIYIYLGINLAQRGWHKDLDRCQNLDGAVCGRLTCAALNGGAFSSLLSQLPPAECAAWGSLPEGGNDLRNPEGAEQKSPGREPWVRDPSKNNPGRARHSASPSQGSLFPTHPPPGLSPWASVHRPCRASRGAIRSVMACRQVPSMQI